MAVSTSTEAAAPTPAPAPKFLITDHDHDRLTIPRTEQETPSGAAGISPPEHGTSSRRRSLVRFINANDIEQGPGPGSLSPRTTSNLKAEAPPGQQLKRRETYLGSEQAPEPENKGKRPGLNAQHVQQRPAWRMSPRMVCNIPYGSGQKSNVNLDLVIVYFFQAGDKQESHMSFFECPEADIRRDRKVASAIASGQDEETPTTNSQQPRALKSTGNGSGGNNTQQPMNWLTHPKMLPQILPLNRTICVGYDFDPASKSNTINFAAAAETLLDTLDEKREDCPTRPIILIGHGLGCRVVKHAFLRAADSEPMRLLQRACIGVLFLHTSADDADGAEKESSAVTETVSPRVTGTTTAVPAAKSDQNCSNDATDQDSEVAAILHHVLQHSAITKEKSQSLRFSTKNDRMFQLLSAKIVEWSEIHQLMRAVTNTDFVTLQELIDEGIRINQRKNSYQMTALHVACQTTSSRSQHIRLLINEGRADVTLQDSHRRTPLHYALDRTSPDLEIVRELLEAGAETFVPDKDGNTPMDLARGRSSNVRKLLRKRPLVKGPSAAKGSVNYAQPHSDQAVDVCKGFQMAATEMYLNRDSLTEKHLPRHFLIDEAIYGKKSLQALLDETRSKSIKEELICRWYHLPANNMAWVEDLFRNRFRMHPNIWSDQVRDSEWPHGRCIKPHTSQFSTESGEAVLAICIPYVSYEDNYRQESVSATVREHIPTALARWLNLLKSGRKELPEVLHGLDVTETLGVPWVLQRRNGADASHDVQHRHQRHPSHSGSEPPGSDEHSSAHSPSRGTSTLDSDSDSDAEFSENGKAVTASGRLSKEEETLVQAYLHHDSPLHIRRTLDQYYYYMLEDTRQRDADQVVTRWARDRLHKKHHNILMVDQLWLWVIKDSNGPDRVISCFPERQGCDPGVLDYLQRNILHHNAENRQPIKTTIDLVAQIIATCSDVFSWSQEAELARFLHFFEATVGRVGDDEIGLLNEFTENSEKLHALKDSHFHYTENKDKFLIEMLDIRPQVTLLKEAKDIRDEIKIILHVLGEQRRVLADETIVSFFVPEQGGSANGDPSKTLTKPLRIIDRAIGDFKKMDKQMKEIHDDLNHLLDLQQKQATVWEARSTREGARATSRQGNVMVIFTMVTIIFLPLSFMASFFALDIKEFPADDNGQTNWPLRRVCAYLFGFSFAVIIPFIALAFASELVYTTCHIVEENWLIPRAIKLLKLLSVSFMKKQCETAIKIIERHREACYGGQEDAEEAVRLTQQNVPLSLRKDHAKRPLSELTVSEKELEREHHGKRLTAGLPRWFRRRRRSQSSDSDHDV